MALSKNIAIIYFSRSSRQEARSKKWSFSDSYHRRLSIAKFLQNQTGSLLNDSTCDIIWHNEDVQVGNSFGEKIAHAFSQTFAQGYKRVICIGNDCIELSKDDLAKGKKQLIENINFFGPTRRNGAYIIGLCREAFDYDAFKSLRWQSKHLANDLKNYLKDNSTKIWDVRTDVNNVLDFKNLLKEAKVSSLVISRIKAILSFFKKPSWDRRDLKVLILSRPAYSLRAPPVIQ